MSTNAKIGHGSKLEIMDYAQNPDAFVEIAEITAITPPAESTDVVDATHMGSPNVTREFILGLTDPGEASFEMNLVPNSVSEKLILASRALRTAVQMRITFPNLVVWTFNGLVTGYQPQVPLADKMTATLNVKVTSSVSIV